MSSSVAGDNVTAQLTQSGLGQPSGRWRATGDLGTARWRHTATLLPNGKVLVTGGVGEAFQSLASAELYSGATGVWTVTSSLATARDFHNATLLSNGQVLVAGGYGGGASAELYKSAPEALDIK